MFKYDYFRLTMQRTGLHLRLRFSLPAKPSLKLPPFGVRSPLLLTQDPRDDYDYATAALEIEVCDVRQQSRSVLEQITQTKTTSGGVTTRLKVALQANEELFDSNGLLKQPTLDIVDRQSQVVASIPIFAKIEREVTLSPNAVTFYSPVEVHASQEICVQTQYGDVSFVEQSDSKISSVDGTLHFDFVKPKTIRVQVIASSSGEFREIVKLTFKRGENEIVLPLTVSGVFHDPD